MQPNHIISTLYEKQWLATEFSATRCTRLNKVGTHSIGLHLSCWKSCIYLLC